jgi:hypothetical protein
MSPRLIALTSALVFGALCFVGGLRTGAGQATAKVQALQMQAAEAKGGEDAARHEADTQRQAADVWRVQVTDAGATVSDLRQQVERLRRAAAPVPHQPAASPGTVQDPVDLAPLVAKQDELIQAQDVKITALEGQVKAQGNEIIGLHKALDFADLRADIQAQASKAAYEGIKKSLWLGRAQGFATGLAVGYVGGRVQR